MDDCRGLRNGNCSKYGSTRAGGHCRSAAAAAIQPRFAHWLYERNFDGCHLAGCRRGTVLYGIVGATVVAGKQTRASLYHGCSSDGGGGNGGGGGDGTTDCV